MAYGITVLNDSSYIQIDENYSNYSLVASGSASSGGSVSFPAGYSHVICMVRAPYGSNIYRSGSSETVVTISGATWEYKMFAKTTDVPQSAATHGFKVFNSAGTCSFSSTDLTLRVGYAALRPGIPTAFPFTVPSIGFHPFIIVDFIIPIGFEQQNTNSGLVMAAVATFNSDNSITYYKGYVASGPPFTLVFGGTRPIIHGR